MKEITAFAQKVLNFLEPDPTEQKNILALADESAPSQADEMKKFKCRIIQARQKNEKVMVAGDYDCDGVISTSIMVDALRTLGIETGFYIPDRLHEGYGLRPKIVELAAAKGYSLLITVDNGVAANEALKKAKEIGLEVIVTDHHQFDEENPPECSLFIHPCKLEEPYQKLCGAGLVYEIFRSYGLVKPEYLQWAATATIADCMPVRDENRTIIRHGLAAMNDNCELHLALLTKKSHMNETDIAFQIVPRINCIGRLSNMANVNSFVRYFLNPDRRQISSYAFKVDELNSRRKQMSSQITELARGKLRLSRPVLMASDPSFHEGIIGTAAGGLCEQYRKPVIIVSESANGCKGSMRAPEGFDCVNFLKPFEKFEALGGHKGAAGFTVAKENLEEFDKFVFRHGREIEWNRPEANLIPITEEEITIENIQSLDALRPFGKTFEAPKFVLKNPRITSVFDLSNGKHRKFTLAGGATALHFNQTSQDMQASVLSIKEIHGTLEISEYQNRKTPGMIIDEIVYF